LDTPLEDVEWIAVYFRFRRRIRETPGFSTARDILQLKLKRDALHDLIHKLDKAYEKGTLKRETYLELVNKYRERIDQIGEAILELRRKKVGLAVSPPTGESLVRPPVSPARRLSTLQAEKETIKKMLQVLRSTREKHVLTRSGYQELRREYEKRLSEIEEEIDQIRREELGALDEEIQALRVKEKALLEELENLEKRRQSGELDEYTYRDLKKSYEEELQYISQRLTGRTG